MLFCVNIYEAGHESPVRALHVLNRHPAGSHFSRKRGPKSLKAKRRTMKALRQRSAEGRLMVCAQKYVKACRGWMRLTLW